MNNNFYAYAKNLLENMSLDELEHRLKSFGIDCERKVTLFTPEQIFSSDTASVSSAVALDFDLLDFGGLTSFAMASNDNSYALAA